MLIASRLSEEDLYYRRFKQLEECIQEVTPPGMYWEFENHGMVIGHNIILWVRGEETEASAQILADGSNNGYDYDCEPVELEDIPEPRRTAFVNLMGLVAEIWSEV